MTRYEQQLFEYYERVSRYMKIQPLVLGGYASGSGGGGGPPGGFIGYLPQGRITGDYTEDESPTIPPSGATLVDNLNKIRYRVTVLENNSYYTTIKDDSVTINPFVDTINISGPGIHATQTGPNDTTIYLSPEITVVHIYNETLDGQIVPSGTHFTLSGAAIDDTLRVYHNGLRKSPTFYTVDGDNQGFTMTFAPVPGDTMLVDYDILIS